MSNQEKEKEQKQEQRQPEVSCDVVMDLLPLVQDGVASEDSCLLVQQHLAHCPTCAELYGATQVPLATAGQLREPPPLQDTSIISSVRKSLFLAGLVLLIGGGLAGMVLSNSSNLFYNLLIMPFLGIMSFLLLRHRWLTFPLTLTGLSYITTLFSLWQDRENVVGASLGQLLLAGLFPAGIYLFLLLIGGFVGWLLQYAFGHNRTR